MASSRSVVADGSAIERAARGKPVQWKELAGLAKVSVSTLDDARKGVAIDRPSLARIAKAPGVTYDSLVAKPTSIMLVFPAESPETWDAVKRLELLLAMHRSLATKASAGG